MVGCLGGFDIALFWGLKSSARQGSAFPKAATADVVGGSCGGDLDGAE